MSAMYSESIQLFFAIAVLFVAAGVALWTREYRRADEEAPPTVLSEEARASLLRASQAKAQKVAEERRVAKKLAKEAQQRAP